MISTTPVICIDCTKQAPRSSNRQLRCGACKVSHHAARERARRAADPEAVARRNRKYRESNRDALKAKDRARYETQKRSNVDEIRAAQRERYAARQSAKGLAVERRGPGGRKAVRKDPKQVSREGYARNREKKQAAARNRRQSNPVHVRVSASVRRAMKGAKAGRPTEVLLGYSTEDLRRHIERQFVRGMGWHNVSEWHIDHIVPVSAFADLATSEASLRRCWALTNLRPVWAQENLRKQAKRTHLL